MRKICTLILVLSAGYTYAQPFSTGRRSVVFYDNLRSSRPITTDLYYPASSAGTNVPLASGVARFPVVVFGHGFLIGTNAYRWLADSLVKNGYIVAMPTTEDGITPSHLDFGLDLSFLAGRITSLNDSSASFLYQRVIKRAAISGHSMGGGASFLGAAVPNTAVRAVFNFAAAETTPSATAAAVLNVKPTLIFSGSSDCVVPDSVQNAMYNSMLFACKTYVNITDALHCQFANNNLICRTGEIVSGCGFTSLPVNTVFNKTTSLLLPFLDYYLKDVCIRGEVFVSTYNTMTGITKRRSCLPFPSCGVVPVKLNSFTGKAGKNRNLLYWSTATEENASHFELERSIDGVAFNRIGDVQAKAATGASYQFTDQFPYSGNNLYRLKMVDKDGSYAYSAIVKLSAAKKAVTVTQLYPNPVSSLLYLQFQAEKATSVQYHITDIAGKKMSTAALQLNSGISNKQLSFKGLAPGIYLLQYFDVNGQQLGTFRIVKQ